MIKKSRSGKIKLPVFEYNWSKEVDTEKPNIELMQDQIDSFIFVINNKEKFKIDDFLEEFRSFSKLIIRHGHLTKLGKEYQEKFLYITKFIKEF
ncbi:MAG: hypothetical protein EU539_07520 [Promethearchaeota archaeon]|nr:MAG: hypothetical protein EU539_07520 [Candidatus Lokiarchaeota archaeon]